MNERSLKVSDIAWRLAYRLGFPVARVWWQVRKRPHEGALVAIFVGEDLLLVKSSYRRAWNFPGGGLWAGEQPIEAARREVREEVGLLAPELMPGRVFSGMWDGRPDRVHVYDWQLPALPRLRLDQREIVEARLFSPGELTRVAVTGPVAAYLQGLRETVVGGHD